MVVGGLIKQLLGIVVCILMCALRCKMGNFQSKSNEDYTDSTSGLSKTIKYPHRYGGAVSVMFNDGRFNLGKVEALYIMSCAVRYYLLVQKHPLRYHYFLKVDVSIHTTHPSCEKTTSNDERHLVDNRAERKS